MGQYLVRCLSKHASQASTSFRTDRRRRAVSLAMTSSRLAIAHLGGTHQLGLVIRRIVIHVRPWNRCRGRVRVPERGRGFAARRAQRSAASERVRMVEAGARRTGRRDKGSGRG